MSFARIAGTGHYLPEKIVTNEALSKTVDTSDAWIQKRTGIQQRHIANETETTAFMGSIAAQNALKTAQIDVKDLDLIIVATTTPDDCFPAVAANIQAKLDAKCPAFDIQAVCSGFIFGLVTAENYIKAGYNNVLLVAAEKMSKLLDWSDRGTCVLFGDGAGAVVLQTTQQQHILSHHLATDGQYYDSLKTLNGHVIMDGREVFKQAVAHFTATARELTKNHQADWFIPHQANRRIMDAVAEKLSFPIENLVSTVEKHANTSAASIPLALDTAIRDGRIQRGDNLLMVALGGGFTWGGALMRY